MKRKLVCLILSFAVIFSLIGCSFDFSDTEKSSGSESDNSFDDESSALPDTGESDTSSENSDTDHSTSDTSSDTSDAAEDSSTDDPQKPDTPKYEDKTDYQTLKKEDKPSVILYGGNELLLPSLTTYYHNYSGALSFTFDDGYDLDSARYVSDSLKKYGMHGTAMISVCFIEDNSARIDSWNSILSEGYLDVGSHGYNHESPSSVTSEAVYNKEIAESQKYLRSVFPGQNVFTFATPFAQITPKYKEYLKNYFISNREASGVTPNLSEDYDKYNIASIVASRNSTSEDLFIQISNCAKNGKWGVALIHCVMDNPSNSTDISKKVFEELLLKLNSSYGDKVWFASFEEVAIYKEQLENAKINYKASDKEKMTFNLTCDLDEEIYNIPMSIKVNVPSFCDTAYVKIGDRVEKVLVKTEYSKKYVYVLDCPVNGEDVEIYLGGNNKCDNGCIHNYETSTVEPSCEEMGYTLKTCSICGNSYKSRFTYPQSHDFGKWEIVENGTEKERICYICSKKETVDIEYDNIAPKINITATDSQNGWAPLSAINDNNIYSRYQSKTGSGTYVEADLSGLKYIGQISIIVENYQKVSWITVEEQEIKFSVYKDGEWNTVSEWNNNDDSYSENNITLTFDVFDNIEKIRIDFVKGAQGSVCVYEMYIMEAQL